MAYNLVRKFLGQEKTPLQRLLDAEGGKSAVKKSVTAIRTSMDSEKYDVRLPDIDHFLDNFYDLDVETVVKGDYNEEGFTPEELGSIVAYRHRAENILESLDQERAIQNHAAFENADYSVPESLARDMDFAEEHLY